MFLKIGNSFKILLLGNMFSGNNFKNHKIKEKNIVEQLIAVGRRTKQGD